MLPMELVKTQEMRDLHNSVQIPPSIKARRYFHLQLQFLMAALLEHVCADVSYTTRLVDFAQLYFQTNAQLQERIWFRHGGAGGLPTLDQILP